MLVLLFLLDLFLVFIVKEGRQLLLRVLVVVLELIVHDHPRLRASVRRLLVCGHHRFRHVCFVLFQLQLLKKVLAFPKAKIAQPHGLLLRVADLVAVQVILAAPAQGSEINNQSEILA